MAKAVNKVLRRLIPSDKNMQESAFSEEEVLRHSDVPERATAHSATSCQKADTSSQRCCQTQRH